MSDALAQWMVGRKQARFVFLISDQMSAYLSDRSWPISLSNIEFAAWETAMDVETRSRGIRARSVLSGLKFEDFVARITPDKSCR